MKNMIFPLLAMLLLASCQNDSKTPGTPPPAPTDAQQLPAALVITPEQVKDADVRAKKLLQDMNQFIEELNTASAKVPSDKKGELAAIKSQVSDGIEKQMMMVKGIEAAVNAPASALTSGGTADSDIGHGAVPPPGVLKDYIESIDLYNKTIDDLRGQFEALKTGSAKKN